jgi:hypothetical protein
MRLLPTRVMIFPFYYSPVAVELLALQEEQYTREIGVSRDKRVMSVTLSEHVNLPKLSINLHKIRPRIPFILYALQGYRGGILTARVRVTRHELRYINVA